MDEEKKLNLTTYEWEENMIDELSKSLNINDKDILTIMATTLLNEVASFTADNQCMLSDILSGEMGSELIKTEIKKYLDRIDFDQLKKLAESDVTFNSENTDKKEE